MSRFARSEIQQQCVVLMPMFLLLGWQFCSPSVFVPMQ